MSAPAVVLFHSPVSTEGTASSEGLTLNGTGGARGAETS